MEVHRSFIDDSSIESFILTIRLESENKPLAISAYTIYIIFMVSRYNITIKLTRRSDDVLMYSSHDTMRAFDNLLARTC